MKKCLEILRLGQSASYHSLVKRIPSKSVAFTKFPYQTIRELEPVDVKKINTNKNASIFVFGVPKSGNVWITHLIAEVCNLKPFEQVAFTHLPLTDHRFDSNLIRAVCIVRDLRDVICSYYRFTKRQGNRDKTTAYFDSISEFYYKYFYFMLKTNFNNIDLMLPDSVLSYGVPVVKYEDLIENPESELIKLFNQWQLTGIDPEKIKSAVEKYTLTKENKPQYQTTEHIKEDHTKHKENENFRDIMPDSLIKHIEKNFGDHLERWGYLLLNQ
jgi:hypothetical protein